ncbi:phosphatase PAP2 family protein [Alkalicoccobacillus murimartini]|uniref:Undecaprenyl-diphosphatase n=1 Tax=Alkalicoccobacillus murimartini TaxID=171685 RepID=A0ABT9YK46_9BACI|nr:phosphatase PAP2 family protein [Alkalicoccobacillus murimartini]MDQ0208225.1 undecaprenyl-diphosphatase [Alkalicoccobacillus murimartini]
MNHKRNWLWLSLSTFCLFIFLSFTYNSYYLQAIDVYVVEGVPSLRNDWMTEFMLLLAWVGGTRVMAVLTLCLMLFLVYKEKRIKAALLPALVMGGTAILNVVAKQLINRSRPDINYLLDQPGFSFPSGHTMAAVSLCGLCIYLLCKNMRAGAARLSLIVAASILVILMGISRMYLGVHFFTDIVGGVLFSFTWVVVAIVINDKILGQMNKGETGST